MATIEITGANTLALGGFFSKWRDLPPHDQEPAPNMVDAGFAKRLGQFLTDWEKNTHDGKRSETPLDRRPSSDSR